jgi:hypothetical protein
VSSGGPVDACEHRRVTSWQDVERIVPEFARRVRARFDAHRHKTIAIAATPITQGADGDRFRADIAVVVHTHLNDEATLLVVEWWTPAHGLRRIERA